MPLRNMFAGNPTSDLSFMVSGQLVCTSTNSTEYLLPPTSISGSSVKFLSPPTSIKYQVAPSIEANRWNVITIYFVSTEFKPKTSWCWPLSHPWVPSTLHARSWSPAFFSQDILHWNQETGSRLSWILLARWQITFKVISSMLLKYF